MNDEMVRLEEELLDISAVGISAEVDRICDEEYGRLVGRVESTYKRRISEIPEGVLEMDAYRSVAADFGIDENDFYKAVAEVMCEPLEEKIGCYIKKWERGRKMEEFFDRPLAGFGLASGWVGSAMCAAFLVSPPAMILSGVCTLGGLFIGYHYLQSRIENAGYQVKKLNGRKREIECAARCGDALRLDRLAERDELQIDYGKVFQIAAGCEQERLLREERKKEQKLLDSARVDAKQVCLEAEMEMGRYM